jgi:type VI secretion system secreted protein VgrG
MGNTRRRRLFENSSILAQGRWRVGLVTLVVATASPIGASRAQDTPRPVPEVASLIASKDVVIRAGKKLQVDVSEESAIVVGKDISVRGGKKLVLEVADEITIRTGDSSLVMKKDGTILLKGKEVTIDAAKINSKGSGVSW